jgi:hypothetical protein
MAPLPDTGVGLITSPLALPVDEDVHRVAVDQHPFNGEFQRDVAKRGKIGLHIPLERIELAGRQQQVFKSAPVSLDIGAAQPFDGRIDPNDAIMVFFILNRLRGATRPPQRDTEYRQAPEISHQQDYGSNHGAV